MKNVEMANKLQRNQYYGKLYDQVSLYYRHLFLLTIDSYTFPQKGMMNCALYMVKITKTSPKRYGILNITTTRRIH